MSYGRPIRETTICADLRTARRLGELDPELAPAWRDSLRTYLRRLLGD